MKKELILNQQLVLLTECIAKNIALFDMVMKEPTSESKGKKLATLIGRLEFANDSAMHFGLGYSFPKIKKLKLAYEKETK